MPSRRVERVAETLVVQEFGGPRTDAERVVYIRVLHRADGEVRVYQEYERLAAGRESGLRGIGIDPRGFRR